MNSFTLQNSKTHALFRLCFVSLRVDLYSVVSTITSYAKFEGGWGGTKCIVRNVKMLNSVFFSTANTIFG